MLDQEMNFYLEGNLDFNDRQKSVFEQLDRLGSQKPSNRFTQDEMKFQSKKLSVDSTKKDLKSYRGKESIFKRPETDMKKKSTKIKIPDFLKNPQKWTKYKLDTDEISEQSNRAVAMEFLKDLKKRNDKMEIDQSSSSVPIKFNRRIKDDPGEKIATIDDKTDDKPSFVNGKFVMPEYVVGQKKKIKKDKLPKQTSPSLIQNPCIKLQHLMDEEEEDPE